MQDFVHPAAWFLKMPYSACLVYSEKRVGRGVETALIWDFETNTCFALKGGPKHHPFAGRVAFCGRDISGTLSWGMDLSPTCENQLGGLGYA